MSSIRLQFQRPLAASLGLAAGLGLVAALALAATPAAAEVIRAADMLRGITITQQQCAAQPGTIWVTSFGRPFCVRYYLSVAGGDGRRPVVFLQGDKFGKLDLRTRSFYETDKFKDVETDDFGKVADALSRSAKGPAIYLARIGVDGTSGHHSARKTQLELALMNAALDAIKKRHGFEGFHLAGQSGGALLVTTLAGIRNDVACAVPGSAQFIARRPGQHQPNPSLEYVDAAAGIPALARKPSLRLLMVTDPNDKQVSGANQTAFAEHLRRAGGRVEQFLVQATDEKHHGVAIYTRLVVSECVRGTAHDEIARKVAVLVEKRVAAAAQAKAQQKATENGGAKPQPQPQQPAQSQAPATAQPGRPGADVRNR
jgi:hypothetical protein